MNAPVIESTAAPMNSGSGGDGLAAAAGGESSFVFAGCLESVSGGMLRNGME